MQLIVFGTLGAPYGQQGAVPVQFNLAADNPCVGTGTCVEGSSTLTVASVNSGVVTPNSSLGGTLYNSISNGIPPYPSYIVEQLTGPPGGAGTYQMDFNAATTQSTPTAFETVDMLNGANLSQANIPIWTTSGLGVNTAALVFPGVSMVALNGFVVRPERKSLSATDLTSIWGAPPFVPSAGVLRTATLSQQYYRTPVPGFASDTTLLRVPAGGSIMVSAAEVFALGLYGGLAMH